jgi:transcriptional regulator with XRE-family HTH domain
MTLQDIGNQVKTRREFLEITQLDLSQMSGITIKTIHLIERGTGNPSFETLQKLGDILGLEVMMQIKKMN